MEAYHVTRKNNVDSILKWGIQASKRGLDGPGVYLWCGPLENAIHKASDSLRDSYYEMSDDEFLNYLKELEVIKAYVPDDAEITVHYENEYFVKKYLVPAKDVEYAGNFYTLYNTFGLEAKNES